ncbi:MULTISPECIES: rhodanese-like domain-containing protein [unclassified Methylobacterium]|uniref:rhodanese-like domain-containing protein n=1 Tax=unclassified Methylobacterium TaxID=2615210 RepID=UPI0006F65D2F|nr:MULTISPECIES: rhodanese-like domain-containing protein [unclassified Methylobacterium]KQP91050.1 sulfurtransferase [Methylobacterium sp. Leaf113]KQP91987.1 sulfurtransferase [Methylobacterium sp. Leaf117]MCK2054239.1 sulfurtransferase [Methylobacterium sp. 37f]
MKVVGLDRDTIKAGLADRSLLLIDVREQHEFDQGHIPGSITHPLSTFDAAEIADLVVRDGRRPVFSCMSGVRSVHALSAAQQAGLSIEEHYAGGFKDWASSGEPIEI